MSLRMLRKYSTTKLHSQPQDLPVLNLFFLAIFILIYNLIPLIVLFIVEWSSHETVREMTTGIHKCSSSHPWWVLRGFWSLVFKMGIAELFIKLCLIPKDCLFYLLYLGGLTTALFLLTLRIDKCIGCYCSVSFNFVNPLHGGIIYIQ